MSSAGWKVFRTSVWAGLALVAIAAGIAGAQQTAANRVIGTVSAVSGNTVTVKTDAGAIVSVTVPDTAKILRSAPGSKSLSSAAKIAVTDMGAGDRVLMAVAGDPPTASIVIVNKAADIAAMQQQEQADWQRRGVGGLVKAVDPAAGTITITPGARAVAIKTSPSTVFRRYAPDSVKFSDAQPSTLASIQPGDQLQARGDKSADGSEVTAEEVVSGSFRNIAGMIVATDASAGTFTVKDLVTKKTVSIKITPDSDMRKLDPQVAQMMAMRLKAAGNGGPGNGKGAGGAAGGQAPGPPGGQSYQGAGGGSGNGQARQGGGNGGGGGLARVLLRSPQIQVSDLHKGDAVMIVATSGNPDAATAIRLVAGVEPMLQASASASQNMFSSAWNLGGGSGGEGDQGGEGGP
ncbi:MAG TPA: hypothetical protein VIY53_14905 [Acidobacteriaceae bacterium]